MRKLLIFVALICLLLSLSVSAQDMKGKMLIGGYAGYSIGFGDAFKDYEVSVLGESAKYSSSAGITFGGHFHYGLSEKMMIGGELMMQSYKSEVEYSAAYVGAVSGSNTETKLNFLFSALYALNATEKGAFFLNFGAGMYDYGTTEVGFFGGFLYRKMMSEKFFLYGAPRLHLVMADETVMLLQLAVGVQFAVGSK